MDCKKGMYLSLLILSLNACAPSDSASSDPTDPTGTPTGTYTSNYCVSDDVTKASEDIYITFDAFSGLDMPTTLDNADPSIELNNLLLYSEVTLGTTSASLAIAFGPMLNTAFCNAEVSADNQCDYSLSNGDGTSFVMSGNVNGNTLIYNTLTRTDNLSSPDVALAHFEGDISPYWNGSFTIYADPTDATSTDQSMTWSRTSSSEIYQSDYPNGDSITITENNDCSGTIVSSLTQSNGTITTVNGSWSRLGNTTTGTVTRCINSNCDTLNW